MLSLKVEKHCLSNGLMVFYCHTPHQVAFEISMHINSGARHEMSSNSGVSHFLEHMMFRGSRNYPNSLLLARAMESFGGEINAMTGVELTNYWMKGHGEKITDALKCFSEFFLFPNFADIEIERKVIIQEMASDFNEEGESIDTESLAMKTLFGENSLGNPIIGSEDVVKKITKVHLEEMRSLFYSPSNCALTINSPHPFSNLVDTIENCFGIPWQHSSVDPALRSYNNQPCFSLNSQDFLKFKNRVCLQNNPDNQFALKLVFPVEGGLSAKSAAITFLQRILDDGICTRLPSNLREKHGLVYDVSCDSQFFKDIGTFAIDATISENCIDDLFEKLGQEIDDFMKEGPSFQEIEHIRYRYLFDLEQIKESPSRLLSRAVTSYFFGSLFTLEDEIGIVSTLASTELKTILAEVFLSPVRGLVLVGPRARKKRDLIEKFLKRFKAILS